ncbi:MAG TPA: OmpH family outer membrane protein [Abditibacteriaceae bacterium]|jgi:Skp family chaperone for outer membrane proteins
MQKKTGLWAVIVMGTLCAAPSAIAPRAAHAQAAPLVGVVDEDKLAEKYTAYRSAIEALDKRAQGLDAQLAARELLADAQGTTFDTLIAKTTRTPAEETQFQNLIKSGNDLRAEYMGLLPKATRTATESARVKTLEDAARGNAGKLRTLSDSLYNDIKKQQEEIDKTYTDRANSVIGQVASDKKLLMVMRQRAIIWNAPSTDITEEVVTRLNK